MKGLVSVLKFDDTLSSQQHFQLPDYEWIDLTDLQGTNGYCEMTVLKTVIERLRKRRNRGITLIGRGNYHYASYGLLTEFSEPLTLVLFDHHSDMLEPPDDEHISCGSWVTAALQNLPHVRKVVLIGVSERGREFIPAAIRSKVNVLKEYNTPVSVGQWLKAIPTDKVYISIDKDVMTPSEVMTDWEQGNMTLDQITTIFNAIATAKQVVGVDICGEYPVSPALAHTHELKEIVKLNEQANRRLVRLAASKLAGQLAS